VRYADLLVNGAAYVLIDFADLEGKDMHGFMFLVDTGAIRTTIPKKHLMEILGYSEEYIQSNKIVLTQNQIPTKAKYGKMIYEIRETKRKDYEKLGEQFVHNLVI